MLLKLYFNKHRPDAGRTEHQSYSLLKCHHQQRFLLIDTLHIGKFTNNRFYTHKNYKLKHSFLCNIFLLEKYEFEQGISRADSVVYWK